LHAQHEWKTSNGQRSTKRRSRTVRYESLDDIPVKPLRTGKGYQSRMGAVLRSYVEAKRKRSA
jgi:uncharacterized protein (DUF4415 family)